MDTIDPNQSGIYAIINQTANRVYVGSAINIKRRWKVHLGMLRKSAHPSKMLQASWLKHGEAAFSFFVLEAVADRTKLIEREQLWMDCLLAHRPDIGYNMTPTAGSQLGFKHSAASKQKMREAKLGTTRPFSEEHRANLSEALRKRFPLPPAKKCIGCDNLIQGVKRQKFCSLACKAKNLNVVISCKSCGKKFSVHCSWLVHKSGRPKRFCSRPCFYKHQKKHPESRNAPQQLEFRL